MGPDSINQVKKPALGGMVGQTARTLQNLPYQRHVQEAKAMGQPPMSPEQFLTQSGR